MKMTETEKHIVKNYSGILNGLSSSGKKELIESLSKSLEAEDEMKDKEFYKAFDAFGSDKSAEEIIADIKASRKFRNKEIRF